jgi:hypothetical protein
LELLPHLPDAPEKLLDGGPAVSPFQFPVTEVVVQQHFQEGCASGRSIVSPDGLCLQPSPPTKSPDHYSIPITRLLIRTHLLLTLLVIVLDAGHELTPPICRIE